MNQEQLEIIRPYVSNTDKSIFTLSGLPEEVIAVLFARYSRSATGDLRLDLANMLTEEGLALPVGARASFAQSAETAARFHEKFVLGYGHGSVAEHAVVHLGIEGVSVIGAKGIEDDRLASFTERSTRYSRFSADNVVVPGNMPEALRPVYRAACSDLIQTYDRLTRLTTESLRQHHPNVTEVGARTKSFDMLRGLLPAGIATSLGLTANARTLAHMISKLRANELAEFRALGDQIYNEAVTVVPTLLKYTAPSEYRRTALSAVKALRPDGWSRVRRIDQEVGPLTEEVRLVSAYRYSVFEVAESILAEGGGVDWLSGSDSLGVTNANQIVDAYMRDRGMREAPGRALEHTVFTFDMACDYGAWRDLQRHRLTSQTVPVLDTSLGWYEPDDLEKYTGAFGGPEQYRAALQRAAAVYEQLALVDPLMAQYVVPLGFRVRFGLTANLRELFHLIELRTGSSGHPSYRHSAQLMSNRVTDLDPWVGRYLRTNFEEHVFAREAKKA